MALLKLMPSSLPGVEGSSNDWVGIGKGRSGRPGTSGAGGGSCHGGRGWVVGRKEPGEAQMLGVGRALIIEPLLEW